MNITRVIKNIWIREEADSYDTMTSLRSYRKPVSNEEALKEIKMCSGTQFDLEIAYAFINLFTS